MLRLIFDIPQGSDGPPGATGQSGSDGQQGSPGEVSSAMLTSAIGGTSSNSNGVALLSLIASDPPTQAEMQALANKMDELINALRR